MRSKLFIGLAAAAVLWAAAAGTASAAAPEAPGFLKGKVVSIIDASLALNKRIAAAREAFLKTGQGDDFFVAYIFPSRTLIRHSMNGHDGPFEVILSGGEVKLHGSRNGENINCDSKDKGGPAGLLLAFSRTTSGPRAVRLLDPEDVYEFKTVPVTWLGTADADSSAGYLGSEFDRGPEKLQKSLVFIISLHDTPRSLDFLSRTARGTAYSLEVRKDAVFWAGTSKDVRGYEIVRDVLATAKESELKKQAVFALTLTDRKEATAELIRVAKTDRSHEVRKEAIFWLGQKASQEAVATLKDVVDKPDENEEIKDSAVFAISQLPKEKSVPMLIAMARTNKSASVRKKALFWLGQTDSDEALKLFEEILTKKD
jgi:hypothetical protein